MKDDMFEMKSEEMYSEHFISPTWNLSWREGGRMEVGGDVS